MRERMVGRSVVVVDDDDRLFGDDAAAAVDRRGKASEIPVPVVLGIDYSSFEHP